MAHIYISLTDSDDAPWVDILTLQSTGEKFLNVHFSDVCRVSLPGYDHTSMRNAFALAAAILKAAEELRATFPKAEVLS